MLVPLRCECFPFFPSLFLEREGRESVYADWLQGGTNHESHELTPVLLTSDDDYVQFNNAYKSPT